ncbi:MAG: translation initiation factor IF-2 [Fimbriimonadaceae bacterium]|nr:translation initiation factor IF-2 [Fimbriimonadaceae bacterium]
MPEVKQNAMERAIDEIAKQHGVASGQVVAALDGLGVSHTGAMFEADDEVLSLIVEELKASAGDKTIVCTPGKTTPRDVANALDLPQNEVLKTLMTKVKVMATLTTALDDEVVEKLAEQFGYHVNWASPAKPVKAAAAPTQPKGAQKRPPVVTILGHVDHGKTSLLDHIREANVVAKEHGGITQHIGAYQVELPQGLITFLDTPGHAAFTAMRARGAQATDIAVLVVAADDGIMPQTIEAISHAKNAEVPIIVAVNKIDKPDANVDKVVQQLPQHDLIPEAFGGDVIVCPVSAHTGEGVQNLLEMILLQADVLELTADPKAELDGVVIEAKLDKGRGPVATVLVEQGTLQPGQVVICGQQWGKVRAMTDYSGSPLKAAGPSTPAEILGLDGVPLAGDRLEPAADEREGRDVTSERVSRIRDQALSGPKRRVSLRDLRQHNAEEGAKDLNLIVKADVQGSVEAVRGLIEKIDNPEVNVSVIHGGVGTVTESDILLASAAGAIVVGFGVKPEAGARNEAVRQKVEIRTYNVIYELIEDIEAAVKGMLEPKFEEVELGKVEIRVAFKLTKAGKVAGSHCVEGKIVRGCSVRVRRAEELVYEGKVASLRNVKEDVREIVAGQDCGIKFEGWEDFKEGDLVEAYDTVQID